MVNNKGGGLYLRSGDYIAVMERGGDWIYTCSWDDHIDINITKQGDWTET